MQPSSRDVLVIGGGPGGSTAASRLAERGRDVLLLEREHFPRFHIGESLLPINVPLLEDLGVAEQLRERGFVRKRGVTVLDGRGEHEVFISFADGMAPLPAETFQVRRSEFDHLLLTTARSRGAEVREGTTVRHAEHDGRGWVVQAESERGTEEIRARFLIDASGRDAFLASRARSREILADHRRVALYGHFRGVEPCHGLPLGNTVLVLVRAGWFWLIPLAGGVTSVGLVVRGEDYRTHAESKTAALESAIQECGAIRDAFAGAERIGDVHATTNYSYETARPDEPDCLAIGDAWAFVDPIFSSGVWLAMDSGDKAARTVDRTLRGRQPIWLRRLRTRIHLRQQERHHRHYGRLIDAFYAPEFPDIFLQPTNRFRFADAMNSILAGERRGTRLRFILNLFLMIVRLQRHLPIQPRIELDPALGPGRSHRAA